MARVRGAGEISPGSYRLYLVTPRPDAVEYQLSGRFRVGADTIQVLLDVHGHLHEIGSGLLTPLRSKLLLALSRAAYYLVVQENPPGDAYGVQYPPGLRR